jgi:hypothetical protein
MKMNNRKNREDHCCANADLRFGGVRPARVDLQIVFDKEGKSIQLIRLFRRHV